MPKETKWRLAKSLDALLSRINTLAPKRSRKSDGTIGDAAHQKAGTSDHLPNSAGVVTAADITHDPANGCDAGILAESLRLSKDRRIKYVIFNKRIFSSTVSPWEWRPYSGSNAHEKHVHVSVKSTFADIRDDWKIAVAK